MGSGLFDHAGFDDGGRDVRRAADDWPFSIAGGQIGDAVHAVLQREDRRIGPEHRRDQRQRRLVVVRFYRDHHDVDATDPGWILFGSSPHCEVAERAASYCQATLADGAQVGSTCDEGDIVTGAGQSCSVVAADSAGDVHSR